MNPRAHVTLFALRHTRLFIVLFHVILIALGLVLMWNGPWWFALIVFVLYACSVAYERVMGVVAYIRFEIHRRVVRDGIHPDLAEMEWVDEIRSFGQGQTPKTQERR